MLGSTCAPRPTSRPWLYLITFAVEAGPAAEACTADSVGAGEAVDSIKASMQSVGRAFNMAKLYTPNCRPLYLLSQ